MCEFKIQELSLFNYRRFENKKFILNPRMNVFLKLGRNKTAAEFTVKAPFINRKNRFIEIHLRYLLN